MDKFTNFREQYPEFIYNSYEMMQEDDSLIIKYHFEIARLAEFTPKWTFPLKGKNLIELQKNNKFLDMVFSLGMVELVSYYKLTCSPSVKVLAGDLDDRQIRWWKHLYYNGLGEFFYTNGIETTKDDFMDLTSEFDAENHNINEVGNKYEINGSKADHSGLDRGKEKPKGLDGYLVPIGGGKDSAVTLELLKEVSDKLTCFIINPRGATLNTVEAAGLNTNHTYVAKRTLDARMIELNKEGFLNGHTPFSAIVAFSSTIAAYLLDIKYIALSNEDSANESTVAGSTVNHQYSKSFEFEKDFHEYEKEYIQSGTYYFSLLRPYSEFQIARLFAGQKAYHSIFRSCNVGSKEDKWCGHCPKCLFVFFILSPFLSHKELCNIFGTDMLEDEAMQPVMDQLIGLVEEKPFECVGSRDEVNTAIITAITDMEKNNESLPRLFEYYKTTHLYKDYKNRKNPYRTYYAKENLVPEKLVGLLKERGTY